MSSSEYWKKREEKNLKKNLKTEAEYTKTLDGYYDSMLDNIQKEINGFYGKYAKSEGITLAEAKRRVSKLDIEAYERKAAKYVKEKNFSKEANDEMRLYNATMRINRLEMLKANIGLELVDGFDGLQKYFDEILTERTLSEFKRQAGILGNTIQNNAQTAKAIVNASFHNAKYSDRIWMYQGMMKEELSRLLQTGLIQGKSSTELARHLTKLFGVRKSDAERLMTTELRRVQTEAAKQSYERNGNEEYTFLTANYKGPCDVCRALDGKHFKVKDMIPGENAPPMHPRCHCCTAPYWDEEEYQGWLDFLDNGGTTKEWNRLKNTPKRSKARSVNTGKAVKFNNKASYRVDIDGYPKEVNDSISKASLALAKLGDRTGHEHGVLVNLNDGTQSDYFTDDLSSSVRVRYDSIKQGEKYAFLHNHNCDTEISFPDACIIANDEEINVIAAIRNDGIITLAESNGLKTQEYLYLEYDDVKMKLMKQYNTNSLSDVIKIETGMRDELLKKYSKGGMQTYGNE